MADNVPITAGSGTNVATDDVSGVHYQKMKLDGGGDGVSSPITGDTTNGLDVDVTRVQGSVTVAQTTAANLNATVAAGTGFPGVATDGSAIISTGTLSMGTDGTNAQTMRMTATGEQYVFIGGDDGAGGFQTASFDATLTDNESNSVSHLNVHSRGAIWNGTGWDRVRGDTTNGMDVDVTRVSGNVTVVQATGSNLNAVVSGTVTANLAAGTNNIGDVDVLSVPAPLSTSGGGTEASALRVTIANDSTGVLSVDDNGSSLTVDGTVTANLAAGTNNIGDVDVLTVPAPLNLTGGGTEGSALRVTIANDSTGVLSVDDNGTTLSVDDGGGSITVDGTVTANAGTGSFTVAQATAANLNATVTGTVTANLAAGTNNIGDVDVLSVPAPLNVTGSGTQASSLRVNIATDNIVDTEGTVAHDGVDSGNPLKIGAKAIAHGTNPTAVAAADRTDLYSNRAGVLFVIGGHPNVQTLRANLTPASTLTNNALVTVSAGTKIVVTRISAVLDKAATVNVSIRVGFGASATPTTTGVLISHPGLAAGSGIVEGNGSGILGVGADGEDLFATISTPTSGSVDFVVSYYTIES